jgi:hypothetical protein
VPRRSIVLGDAVIEPYVAPEPPKVEEPPRPKKPARYYGSGLGVVYMSGWQPIGTLAEWE